ncbi:MAG: hypothetical protein K0U72_04605 [Gammaproteobacteria bacterium]|nr:hypothetical protein [Gammaproteobacteria bacterium]
MRVFRVILFVAFLSPISVVGQSTDAGKSIPTLTNLGADNLYVVGKLWGYIKYHHPAVTNGCLDWDQELLDRLQMLRDQGSRDDLINEIDAWVEMLDSIEINTECRKSAAEVAESRSSAWIADTDFVGRRLSRRLQDIDSVQSKGVGQHYVSLRPGVGNPVFQNEPDYSTVENLDWRYRVLAVYRFWNIVEYWSPYRSLIDSDFDEVLRYHIAALYSAEDPDDYVLALMMLTAAAEDAHTNLWSSIKERPPNGIAIAPFAIRFVEGKPIVWKELDVDPVFASDETSKPDGLKVGDVIFSIDGKSINQLIETWEPYYGVSNESSLLREIGRNLLRGDEGRVDLEVDRNGVRLSVSAYRIDAANVDRSTSYSNDLVGGSLQKIENDISYVKLSTISEADVAQFNEHVQGSDALIIDIRGYPKTFVVFSIGQHLFGENTHFARFTSADLSRPGTFKWGEPIAIPPKEPFFDGHVVLLVDETTQSQAEYTTMAFRANSKSVVIGSQTAGADGNVSHILLPGGHQTMISGIGVFYPDKSPTQKVGIVPDLEVRPTIKGIRAGRDEVLEAAIEYIQSRSD